MRSTWLTSVVLLLHSVHLRAEGEYFRDIKPLLTARCASCHGAVRQKGGLRLDAATLILMGTKRGPVVIPGNAEASPLLAAVQGRDRPRMPPESEGSALTPREIALLKAWIDGGAKAPEDPVPPDPRMHWAFRAPTPPHVPEQAGHPIDAFLDAERKKRGIPNAPLADKATLLRRVTLDLTGLPPTREELHAFLADPSPRAYETVVERLLASPHHGERWGRHWMDVWRYSDPFGLGEEYRYSHRHIWRWRDWIVESLNRDTGYDAMIVAMLAGDEIAPANRETLSATGYLARNWYKFNRNAWLFDTVEHTATGFLGLTLRCARCHDHKYDPLNQQDYYRFRAFFEPHDIRIDAIPGQSDTTRDGVARAFDAKPETPTFLFQRGDDRTPDTSRALTPAVPAFLGGELAIRPIQFQLRDFAQALPAAVEAERAKVAKERATVEAAVVAAEAVEARARTLWQTLASGKPGPMPSQANDLLHDTFTEPKNRIWKVMSGQWGWQGGRLRQQTPSSFATLSTVDTFPENLMGRVRYRTLGGPTTSVGFAFDVVGNQSWQAVYTHCKANSTVQAFHRVNGVEVYPPAGIVPQPLALQETITLDFAVRGTLLNVWVNGVLKIAYRLPTPRQRGTFALWNHEAISEFLEVRLLELPESMALEERITGNRPSPMAGPVVVSQADAERAWKQATEAVTRARRRRIPLEATETALEARLAADKARFSEPADPTVSRLAEEAARAERRAALLRAEEALEMAEGNATAKKNAEKALTEARTALTKTDGHYTPLVAFQPATSTGRRLALARWIASRDNPLTARVAVNQVWLRHFGRPLVPTVANWGLSGKPPTHPQLLDWLALRFMEEGWSFKTLHRWIVTSEAYRRSSIAPTVDLDPDNVWLGRMNSRRLEAETVRDSLFALGGTLDRTLGGPILDIRQGLTLSRRSLYFRFNTEYRVAFLEPFDAPSPSECYERPVSVIPQQALALSNSALALSQARSLARRLTPDTPSESAFVVAAFEAILGRAPREEEQRRCERFLTEATHLLKNPGSLTPFPASPDPVLPAAPEARLRARENLVQVLLNHNDFITVR